MYRGHRLRKNAQIRSMVQETHLHVEDLIYPLFVVEGTNIKQEISSLKNNYHYSVDRLDDAVKAMQEVGVKACILFGVVEHKDACGSEAYNPDGVVQQAIRKIKEIDPKMYVIADVCMCEYTDHGHCGILNADQSINNDATCDVLSKIALSYAQAGVDMVAPSDMMDLRIQKIRQTLDENGFVDLPIMAYSAKYASSYYGPFREAAHSAPSFGDRKAYQMDFHNKQEALLEMQSDADEGADILMVKPAMAYLDIINEAKKQFEQPIAAYQVSGEYAMLNYAVDNNIMNEKVIYESLIAIKRAGADLIITYFALDVARAIKEGKYENN